MYTKLLYCSNVVYAQIWLLVSVTEVLWMYFCSSSLWSSSTVRSLSLTSSASDVESSVNPVLYDTINHSTLTRDMFTAATFIFGFSCSSMNLVLCYAYVIWLRDKPRQRSNLKKRLIWPGSIFLLPLWLFLIIMPLFGEWFVVIIVEQVCPPPLSSHQSFLMVRYSISGITVATRILHSSF